MIAKYKLVWVRVCNNMKIKNKLNKPNFIELLSGEVKEDDCVIDLSEIKFADIFGILSLILLIKRQYKNGNKIKVYMPRDINVSNYLNVCGFTDYVGEYTYIKYSGLSMITKMTRVTKEFENKEYIPINEISNDEDVNEIITKLKFWLSNRKVDDSKIHNIRTLLLELFGNIQEHSKSEDGCIFAMQKYKDHLMIGIVDFGIGIKNSLENNQKYSNMFDSTEQVLKHIFTDKNYISSVPEDTRGNGFLELNQLSLKEKEEFSILSNDGYYTSEYIGGKNTRKSIKNYDLSGTLVIFCIKL